LYASKYSKQQVKAVVVSTNVQAKVTETANMNNEEELSLMSKDIGPSHR
jgi:hypothetical protein